MSMTALHIDAGSILSDVQEEFQKIFPDLKLEFFFSSDERLNTSHHLPHGFPYISIGELCDCTRETTIDIMDTMTVAEVEEQFRQRFGLPAKIYVRTGEYWLKNNEIAKFTLKH